MKTRLVVCVVAALCGGLALAALPVQDGKGAEADPLAAFANAGKFLATNENHQWLGQLAGEWDVTMRLTMMPGQPPMESKGKATGHWLMEGRWLAFDTETPMMGQAVKSTWTLGYDNFKKKYVGSVVNSMETALRTAEGFRDQSGTALHLYGTLDEYLTGEHDKMVRYSWSILSPDHHAIEVHDLAIGIANTKVIEFDFVRRK